MGLICGGLQTVLSKWYVEGQVMLSTSSSDAM